VDIVVVVQVFPSVVHYVLCNIYIYIYIYIQEGYAQTATLRVLVRSEGGLGAKVSICDACAADLKQH